MDIALLNYGAGNLYSIQAALRREGAKPRVTRDPRRLRGADAVLLPGVGSFTQATSLLPGRELRELASAGKPILGICLGLQLFFDRSEEGPGKGLGLLPGAVRRLRGTLKVPQIGWNTLNIKKGGVLVDGVADGSWVYYVHSYYPETSGPWVEATSTYGEDFPSVVVKKSLYGTQFHPEKSGVAGRTILRNFLAAVRR